MKSLYIVMFLGIGKKLLHDSKTDTLKNVVFVPPIYYIILTAVQLAWSKTEEEFVVLRPIHTIRCVIVCALPNAFLHYAKAGHLF